MVIFYAFFFFGLTQYWKGLLINCLPNECFLNSVSLIKMCSHIKRLRAICAATVCGDDAAVNCRPCYLAFFHGLDKLPLHIMVKYYLKL